MAVDSYMMPFSNVAHFAFPDKLGATARANCAELSLMPIEVERIVAAGTPIADMLRMATDHGVRITRLDPLNTWSRIWRPDNMDEAYIATVDTTADAFFALTDALECTHMSLNATFPRGSISLDAIIEDYAAICSRAATHGLICDLEFVPLWGVPDLATAWSIVAGSGAANGGLVFDAWHFVRSGSHLEDLMRLPAGAVHCVQLNDGPLALPPGQTVKDNCYDRLFPGDGEFPLTAMLGALDATGSLRQVGAEVFSPMLTTMSMAAVADKSAASIAAVLAQAGIAP